MTNLPASAKSGSIPGKLLADAARSTKLKDIDIYQEDCSSGLTVGAWLTKLTGADAAKITWTGGACQLKGPGPLDGGSDWCGQATIRLKNPKPKEVTPMIEVYFEKPVKGRPGKAYAFRGIFPTADGPDISRFIAEFSSEWRTRFSLDYERPEEGECEE